MNLKTLLSEKKSQLRTTLSLHCFAPTAQHKAIKDWCLQIEQELEITILLDCSTASGCPKVSLQNNDLSVSECDFIKGSTAQIKIISNCCEPTGNILKNTITIGLNNQVDTSLQMTCFLSSITYQTLRSALLHLVLNPHESKTISQPIFPTDILILDDLHKKCIRNNLNYHIPKNQKELHGRILWIDANPHIDTILDPYGLSILNTIAWKSNFLGHIVSPFSQWHAPEEKLQTLIQHFSPDLIGISIRNIDDVVTIRTKEGNDTTIDTSNYLKQVQELISPIVKNHTVPIILGGASMNRTPKKIMKALAIPYGISGAGEQIMDDFFNVWRPKEHTIASDFNTQWNRVQGTLNLQETTKKATTKNVQSQYSKHSIYAIRNPISLWHEQRLGVYTAIRGTYGCPLNCTYCIEATPGKKVQIRNAKDVVDEMEWMFHEYAVTDFHLTDSEANLPFSKISTIAEEIIHRNLGDKIKWTMYSTPHPWDIGIIPLLIKAGMRGIKLSVDHFVDRQLKKLGRTHKEKQIHKVLDAFAAYSDKLHISCSILLGGPEETLESIAHAANYMIHYAKKGILFYYNVGIRIYPGTPLHDDWKNGQLNAAHLYGFGLNDDAISPLVYSSPSPSRILTKKLQQEFESYANIRGIEMGRLKHLDDHLRLLMIALAEWYKGNVEETTIILKKLNIYLTTNANLVEKILLYEREIRRFNRIPEWVQKNTKPFFA